MATSAATHPLLMAATEPTRLERTTNSIVTPGADQNRQEQPSKPRPRKMAKQHPPKKQPQRGMGVAQLERLRLQDQERWTKMPEVPPQPYPPYFLLHGNPQRPGFSFPGPLDAAGGVPVQQYCAPPTRPPSPVSTGLGLGLGMGRGFLVQRKDDGGGDHGRLAPASAPGQVMFDAFGAGAPAGRGGSSKAVETSRELSSIPNAQQCMSDRCDVCLKKKRMDSQNAGLFVNRARENYPEKMRVGNCDFLGLNLEIPQSKAAARTPIYTAHNLDDDDDQNVEVTAIRRRVNISGGGVSMEYEFFPGKSGRSTWTEGLNFPAQEEAAADTDASEDGGEASNSIDLSLKLSC
ncbi:uncharacterized protein LOC130139736 isoform X1 [Syzygium oleosum]|uniref:uncharacterized protein LOC130139736 isoform X1 n=1 Tax=Syzygium oleosum TaxID=219896 RepID=UPI0024B96A67|nr:uncharacterized protein LOC130139736 isoform X1 [Syzygium oleosum]